MAYETAVIAALLGLMFWLVYFLRSLEDGKHDIVKFLLSAMAFIMGTQVITVATLIANDSAATGVIEILGTTYWLYSFLLGAIILYFILQIGRMLIEYLKDRNKNKIQEPIQFGGR